MLMHPVLTCRILQVIKSNLLMHMSKSRQIIDDRYPTIQSNMNVAKFWWRYCCCCWVCSGTMAIWSSLFLFFLPIPYILKGCLNCLTKGQLISEQIYAVLNFPKMQQNIARISALASKMGQIKNVKAHYHPN